MNHFILSLCLGALLLSAPAYAEDLYVGQSDAGVADGTSCANQHSAAWFNTAANWGGGAGEIDPGDTAHLCGTITSSLAAQGSGSVGSVVTVLWETGAKLSQAVCPASPTGCFNTNGKTYLLLNGGTNGIIESTANGSVGTYANQSSSVGIMAFPCNNCEIKNLTIQNIYVHNSASDVALNDNNINAIRLSGSNTSVHHNTLHDGGRLIFHIWNNGDANIDIHHNECYNNTVCWVVAATGPASASNFNFYNNHAYNHSNWDTSGSTYHYAGVHAFGISNPTPTGYSIYNNLFEGTCGTSLTSQVYMEGGSAWTGTGTAAIYNNVMTCEVTTAIVMRADKGDISFYNNTIIGTGIAGTCYYTGGGTLLFKNNAITGCSTLVSIDGATVANRATDFNYNTYACQGSFNCFNWTGLSSFERDFATWQTACGCDPNSSQSASLLVSSVGVPTVGSPVIDTGTDLSGLGITALNSDYLGISRPSGTIWDTGAYEFVSGRASRSPASARTQATARTIR